MIETKGGDSSESRYEERLLRVKAQRYGQELKVAALISAKTTEIRQIELFVVRLESVRLEWKSTVLYISDS